MKTNLDQELINLDGEPIYSSVLKEAVDQVLTKYPSNAAEFVQALNEERGSKLTIGLVFRRSLLTSTTRDRQGKPAEEITPDEAQRRFLVAQEMMKGGEYDLKEVDRDIIKKNMMKIWLSIQVTGQVMNILNPRKEEVKDSPDENRELKK